MNKQLIARFGLPAVVLLNLFFHFSDISVTEEAALTLNLLLGAVTTVALLLILNAIQSGSDLKSPITLSDQSMRIIRLSKFLIISSFVFSATLQLVTSVGIKLPTEAYFSTIYQILLFATRAAPLAFIFFTIARSSCVAAVRIASFASAYTLVAAALFQIACNAFRPEFTSVIRILFLISELSPLACIALCAESLFTWRRPTPEPIQEVTTQLKSEGLLRPEIPFVHGTNAQRWAASISMYFLSVIVNLFYLKIRYPEAVVALKRFVNIDKAIVIPAVIALPIFLLGTLVCLMLSRITVKFTTYSTWLAVGTMAMLLQIAPFYLIPWASLAGAASKNELFKMLMIGLLNILVLWIIAGRLVWRRSYLNVIRAIIVPYGFIAVFFGAIGKYLINYAP